MRALWEHVYGDLDGVLALFSGLRGEPGSKRLSDTRSAYFDYSRRVQAAEEWCSQRAAEGREVYSCAHLLIARRRIKTNAAPLLSLYVDGDGAKPGCDVPVPTAIVESSPGREQFYFRLTEPIAPQIGERLNRRLALAMGADDSGWDLTQLLRSPGTCNYKYPGAPVVQLIEVNDSLRYDPDEVDRLLPPEPDDYPENDYRATRPAEVGSAPDLLRLSPRMQNLIRYGNGGEYQSRSNADMAVCVAMFGAGYSMSEIWAVMTDPTNGIAQKVLEKGRHGERYLALTIGKAEARKPRGKSKARRVWECGR